MNKKSEKKMVNRLLKMQEREEIEINKCVCKFYENGEIVHINSTLDKDPFLSILPALRKDTRQTFTQDQMIEKCSQIREHLKNRKALNTEIDFRKMLQRFDGFDHDLHSTLIRIFAMNGSTPFYLHIFQNNKSESTILIGGDDAQAFLQTKDEDGKDFFLQLEEIDMLSYTENSILEKEKGLITEYSWLKAKISYSILLGLNVKAIETIMKSEMMRERYWGPREINKEKEASNI